MNRILGIAGILACAIISNYPSLYGGFVFDDTEAILTNSDVTGNGSMAGVFSHDFWGEDIRSKSSHKSYRPITVLMFRLDSYWSGEELNPAVFHIHNVILYVVVCLLYRSVVERLSGSSDTADWSAVLFASHPIHTESVSGIVGRAEMTSSIFYLLGIATWMNSLWGGVNGTIWLLGTGMLGGLAMLSKEQGITVLGVCMLWELLLIINGQYKCNLWWVMCRSVIYFVSILTLGYLRWILMEGNIPTFQEVDNPASFASDWLTRILTYNYIWALNTYLLALPFWLCFDWSMGCIPLIDTLLDGRNVISLLMWLLISILVYRSVKNMELSCGIVAITIPFLPATNLLFRVGFVVAERTLFVPSMGSCYLVARGLETYICRSFSRSMDWISQEDLYRSGIKVCPLNAKIHYNIAKVISSYQVEEAELRYREAIRLYPDYEHALNNLGNLLKERGNLLEAHQLLVRAVEVAPKFAAAWMNRGTVETDLKLFSQSEQSILTAIKHRNNYPDAYYNLGNLYLAQEMGEMAQAAYRKSINLKIDHISSWINLCLSLQNENSQETERTMDEAITLFPNEQQFIYSKANYLGKIGKYSEAEYLYKQLIQLSPDVASYHGNLGVLYHLWGKLDQSADCYMTSLSLQDDVTMGQNYNKLLKKLSRTP
ncbi:Transmembrane and TPR repeat-containing protein [Oopsacas minuta]|uniref:dolichyl-phosphate-mannose--protein mannosyltransferase n=1 Tax=Oopsacas minuta TaxID=111878 RepID=A0AAV7KG50_9METZ|nr:Transmembrane and TPR repeat-containing protein [Oopsacas minuta]